MNRVMKRGVMACMLAAFALQMARAEDEVVYQGAPDAKSYGYTVLAVGLITPVALPWGFDWDIFGLDVNLLYGDCNKMYGFEVAGLANVARLDMYGLQASIAYNFANRDAVGAQVALVNMCNRSSYGIEVDALGVNREFYGLSADILLSMTDSNFYGLSVAGLGSGVREDMWGWQLAVGATFARRVHGFQSSIIFNMTDDLRGAQLGLVNYAATCSAGFQVGLINMIMDNQAPILPIFNCYF